MSCSLRNGSYTSLFGKTVIVTGANAGIGYMTALDFAMRGGRVVLACRSKEKAEEAQRKIIEITGNTNVIVKLVDFESLESVRKFAKDFNETEQRLDILVNNAAAVMLGNKTTNDGLHISMQINHFSPFLLTLLLIDKLKASAPSRIVNVASSAANMFTRLDVEDLNKHPKGSTAIAETILYNNTKLCNVLFTVELAKKLEGTGVTANCLHPGAIKTGLTDKTPGFLGFVLKNVKSIFFKSVVEGAQTTIYVALSKDVEGVTGQLFQECKKIGMYKKGKDVVLAKKVWIKSEEHVKLRDNERLV